MTFFAEVYPVFVEALLPGSFLVNVVSEESNVKSNVGRHKDRVDKKNHHRKKLLELHLLTDSAKPTETEFYSFCKSRI